VIDGHTGLFFPSLAVGVLGKEADLWVLACAEFEMSGFGVVYALQRVYCDAW